MLVPPQMRYPRRLVSLWLVAEDLGVRRCDSSRKCRGGIAAIHNFLQIKRPLGDPPRLIQLGSGNLHTGLRIVVFDNSCLLSRFVAVRHATDMVCSYSTHSL